MEIRKGFLLKVSWYIGLISLIGGWSIYLIWLAGRYIGAWDFNDLEIMGVFWAIAFFWLCLTAIITLLIYIVINRKSLHIKMLWTAVIILLNIPSVIYVVSTQNKIAHYVFIKLNNESGLENLEFTLIGDTSSMNIGSIDNGSSNVFHYDPIYPAASDWYSPERLQLIVSGKGVQDTIEFPCLFEGKCEHIVFNENGALETP